MEGSKDAAAPIPPAQVSNTPIETLMSEPCANDLDYAYISALNMGYFLMHRLNLTMKTGLPLCFNTIGLQDISLLFATNHVVTKL